MLCFNDNTKASRYLRLLAFSLALLIPVLVAPSAQAVLLQYSFSGVAGTGSSLDFDISDEEDIDLEGIAFTASGYTISDVDLDPDNRFGVFLATTTYNFGGWGVFQTDWGAEFYVQGCDSETTTACAGLIDALDPFFPGIGVLFDPIPGDPNLGGIPLGTLTLGSFLDSHVDRTQLNSLGHSLTLAGATDFSLTLSSVTVTVIPEPATLALMGIGLFGLAGARKKIKK